MSEITKAQAAQYRAFRSAGWSVERASKAVGVPPSNMQRHLREVNIESVRGDAGPHALEIGNALSWGALGMGITYEEALRSIS